MSKYLSWNRLPNATPDRYFALDNRNDNPFNNQQPNPPYLVHGHGRSYGDVCLLNQGTLFLSRGLDRFIKFDTKGGIIRCEAGITLSEILALVVPQGWFLMSTPGTRLATIGGAVANDVHGKNHHEVGSFGHHVRALELLRSDGEVIECSPDHNREWFEATIGGLGLTGMIRWVEIELMSIHNSWIWVESQRFSNLDHFWELNLEAELDNPYTVSWIDCLAKGKNQGRGILLAGKHASIQDNDKHYKESSKKIPIDPPISLVNNLSLRLFNALYYRQKTYPSGQLSHYVPYFYPLDAIANWNRIYGRRGFYQYQCVLPPEFAKESIAELLDQIAQSGEGSFLAVLKTFGAIPSIGMLSFPREGATLALDFPNRGERTLALFNRLDHIVSEASGALYPAKDARMSGELFRSGYPKWEAFSQYIDPHFSSLFWQRVTS